MKSKLHLRKEGLDKILLIKSRIKFNRGRGASVSENQ